MVAFNTAEYAPGVYVIEQSTSAPIAGVGTSTAGFIGVVPDSFKIAVRNPAFDPSKPVGYTKANKTVAALTQKVLAEDITLGIPPVIIPAGTVLSADQAKLIKNSGLTTLSIEEEFDVGGTTANELQAQIVNEVLVIGSGNSAKTFNPGDVLTRVTITGVQAALGTRTLLKVQVEKTLANVLEADLVGKLLVKVATLSTPNPPVEHLKGTVITEAIANAIVSHYSATSEINIEPTNFAHKEEEIKNLTLAPVNEPKLCTNFGDFKAYFGDFSLDPGQNILAHAVYGFFRNGGTRCYVVRVLDQDKDEPKEALEAFEAIDDIAIVAAPGITAKTALTALDAHCKQKTTQDRVAIFDSPETVGNAQKRLDITQLIPGQGNMPSKSDYAAYYFPWIKVFDPVEKLKNPAGDGLKAVPPSGHMAGIYARVDSQRGVHKAPANEPILGAVDVTYAISKGVQASLNKDGINCIRNLNGSLLVWGARTLGGDANGEFKYINVRRLMNYLRESIDEGTQWVVFEPNSPELWARIRREISAFLTTVWRSGALFGDTPEQAFYIKCNAETNPPANRDNGVVVAEIGVAIVRPAEFVVFSISQWAGAGN